MIKLDALVAGGGGGGRWARPALVAGSATALAASLYFAWRAHSRFYDSRANFDGALPFYGLALLLLLYFAWQPRLPQMARSPQRAAAALRAHRLEIGSFLGVFAMGVFLRLHVYGELPPAGALVLEEHINGGVAWEILQGERPLNYLLVRYSTALGIWLFGPSTDGLRLVFVAAAIVTIPAFYLLMRQLVAWPAAVFATGMLAASGILTDTSFHMPVSALASVLFVLVLIRGLRTGQAAWFVVAGFLAAVLSYEYEAHKAVPLFAAGFVAFAAARALPRLAAAGREALRARVRAAGPRLLRAGVALVLALFIGLSPMLAQQSRGERIYLGSLDRQQEDRRSRGTPGLLAPNAGEQLRWALQAYTPFVEQTYPSRAPSVVRDIVDTPTSLLIWAGFVAALLGFWRGERALFLAWFGGGILGAALLVSNFEAWKIAPFVVPALVLAGYFADDALGWLQGLRRPRIGLRLAVVPLAALVVAVFVLNLRALDARAADGRLLREYAGPHTQLFMICDYLNDRPAGNFSYVAQKTRPAWGFAAPELDSKERRVAWGDYKFACWGLQGRALADLRELWPATAAGLPLGAAVTVVAIGRDELEPAVEDLRRALPELGRPDVLRQGPGGAFHLAAFELTAEELASRRGLVLRVRGANGELLREGATANLVLGPAPAGAASFELTGLVYAPPSASPRVLTAPGRAAIVLIDGETSSDSAGAAPKLSPRPQLAGWHLVRVRGPYAPGALLLAWQDASGGRSEVTADDLFALADTAVWQHTRRFEYVAADGRPVETETQRFDFRPYVAATEGMLVDGRAPLPAGGRVLEDRWRARWQLAGRGVYTLEVASPSAPFRIALDGRTLSDGAQAVRRHQLNLEAGSHRIEIVFQGQNLIGGTLSITDEAGNVVQPALSPF